MNLENLINPALRNAMNLGNKVTVISLNLIETGTYNPLASRSFNINTNVNEIKSLTNSLSERVMESNLVVTPELVAGLSNNLITPSATVGDVLSIPNGWDTPRFRFMMRVKVDLPSGFSELYDVQGYTDKQDASLSGHVDANMRMYINSMNKISEYSNTLGQTSYQSTGSSQILNGAISATPTGNGVFAMRPKDVVGEIQMQYMQNDAGSNYRDGRANISGRATGSNRNNAVPSSFLSSTLSNWLNTARDNDIANDQAIVNNTLIKLMENFYEENKFVSELIRTQGAGNGGYFTLKTLEILDNTFTVPMALATNRLNIMFNGGVTNEVIPVMGMGSHWFGRDIEAIWSTTVSQAIPAIMSKHFIGKLAFTSTNKIAGGGYDTRILSLKSPTLGSMSDIVGGMVVADINNQVLKDITVGGMIPYTMLCQFDIYGTTIIDVAVDNNPMQKFIMPSFCDSISSPILTNSKENLVNMALGIESLMRTITDNVLGDSSNMDNLPTIDLGL